MKKRKREKNIDLPGIEGPGVSPVKIKAIDAAAENYLSKHDRLMTAKKVVETATAKVVELVKANAGKIGTDKNGEIVYRYDGVIVSVQQGKDKLKVREVGPEGKFGSGLL